MAKKNEAAAVNTEVNVVLKKRGRKSKKELESALQAQNADNINVTIEDCAEANANAHSCECLSAEMENSAAGHLNINQPHCCLTAAADCNHLPII